jgi:type I restriction enzyme S subunit
MIKLKKDIWKTAKLGEICEINMGKTPSRNNLANFGKGYTWLSIADFKGDKYLSKSKEEITDFALTQARFKPIKQNTLLLTFKLTIGKIAIAGKELYTNEAIAALPIKNEKVITTDFLYTILQTIDYDSKTDKAVKGATLNKEKLTHLSFPLPPLEEQKQIAALFQSIETAMEQVDGQEKNLKALQKSLVNGLLSKEPEFGNLLNIKKCIATTFGEIAECDKKYPEHEKEVERFVGLEWIEADNFQLQGFGLVANGTTFTKRFVKGDVLFGKRRAYLKKVAVADFDGICSGDILVIRAKAKKMLQGLLPYYISADAFINHAVSTSAGSLSPRTKWKDLAELEVSIPDIKTQSTILEVLQQLDNTVNQLKQQKITLKNLKQKLLNEILG